MSFNVGDRVRYYDAYYHSYIPPNVRGTVLGTTIHSDYTDFDYIDWDDPESIEDLSKPVLSEKVAVQWDSGCRLLHRPDELTPANVLERLSEIE